MSNFAPAENQKPSTHQPFDQPPPKLSKWGAQMKYNKENSNPPLNKTEDVITTQPLSAENIRTPPGGVNDKYKNLEWYEICAPYYGDDFLTRCYCNIFCRPLSLIGQCLHNVVLCCPAKRGSRERNNSRGQNVTRNARVKNVKYTNAYRSPRRPNYNTRHDTDQRYADDNYYVDHNHYNHYYDDYVTNNVNIGWNVNDVTNRENECVHHHTAFTCYDDNTPASGFSHDTGWGASEVSNTGGGNTGHSHDTGGGYTGGSCDAGGGDTGGSYDTGGGGDTGGSCDTGGGGDTGGSCDTGGGDSGGGGCD